MYSEQDFIENSSLVFDVYRACIYLDEQFVTIVFQDIPSDRLSVKRRQPNISLMSSPEKRRNKNLQNKNGDHCLFLFFLSHPDSHRMRKDIKTGYIIKRFSFNYF